MKTESFADDQVFLCQHCGVRYFYGPTKEKMAFGSFKNRRGGAYHPGVFCCINHEDAYLEEHGRYPAVGYEIPLGDWEPSTPGLIKASEGYVTDPVNGRTLAEFYDEVVQMRIAGGKPGEANANKDVFTDAVPFAAPPSPPVEG